PLPSILGRLAGLDRPAHPSVGALEIPAVSSLAVVTDQDRLSRPHAVTDRPLLLVLLRGRGVEPLRTLLEPLRSREPSLLLLLAHLVEVAHVLRPGLLVVGLHVGHARPLEPAGVLLHLVARQDPVPRPRHAPLAQRAEPPPPRLRLLDLVLVRVGLALEQDPVAIAVPHHHLGRRGGGGGLGRRSGGGVGWGGLGHGSPREAPGAAEHGP